MDNQMRFVMVGLVFAFGCAAEAARVSFNEEGPATVRIADRRWPVEGGLAVRRVVLENEDGETTRAELGEPKASWDAELRVRSLAYAWGDVTCAYENADGRLAMTIEVHNTSTRTIHQIGLGLLTLQVGDGARGGGRHHNIGAPTVLTARWEDGVAAACNEEMDRPLQLALSTKGGQIRLGLTAGGDRMVYDTLFVTRPIPAGQSDTYKVSLRFGTQGTNPRDLAQDIYAAFRHAHPPLLRWEDHRPINRLFFRGGWDKDKIKQWFKDPDTIDPPKGASEEFRGKILGIVDKAIEACKAADAQGIIIWNLEGSHRLNYVGDPRLTHVFHPEMDAVADEMFARIHKAGLLSGVCIRPTQIVYEQKNDQLAPRYGPVLERYAEDPAFKQLDAKIAYCRERWGTRIFYVDTPGMVRPRGPEQKWSWGIMRAEVWRRLMEKYPDILIMPEFGYPEGMAYTVGYSEYDMGFRGTSERVERIYPDAWTVAAIEDADPTEKYDLMVRNVRDGDSLQTFSFSFHRNARFQKHIFTEADFLDAGVPDSVEGASVGQLTKLLESEDARSRFYASRQLGEAGQQRAIAVSALLKAAKDDDADFLVRKNAVVSLGRLRAETAVPALVELLKGKRPDLRHFAAEALGEIGSPALPPVLEKAMAGQRKAVTALGLIGDPKAVPALSELVARKGSIRRAAMHALGRIGGERATDLLAGILRDAEEGVYARSAAANALARTGRLEARAALEEVRAEARKNKDLHHLVWVIGRALGRMK